MSENKFIKRLKGEQTAKSVLEIKNESAKTSFANMPQGTSNALNVYSDHRGNATAVLNGTTNWKVSNSELLLADTVSGDGQDFISTYSVSGTGLWVNASYTFPSTGDPRHPIAMVFNPSTKWVLKVCGDNLIVDGGSTIDFTMLVKIGTANVYSKNFTVRESAGQFSKEFVIDFGEANLDIVKAGGLSTLTVQLLCGTANASARIYNGMTVLTCLQRKVDASAVSNSSANVEDVLDGNMIPSDYFSNPAFIDQIEDGNTAVAIFARDGDDVNLDHWEQPIPDRAGNAGKFLQTPDGDKMSWEDVEISDVTGLQTELNGLQGQITTNKNTMDSHIGNTNNPHQVTKAQVGLGNVDNTSDLNKPISTATQTALNSKQDVISDLSTIRSGAALGATAVQPGDLATVAITGSYNDLSNKPTIPTVGNGTITITQGGITKGTFTTNQSGNTTIALDAGGGGGAVDSVNGKTGVVVLTATDVGALPDSTVIPTVNNPTITITQGGVTKGSFTLNQATGDTIELDAGGGSGSGYHPDLFDAKWADHICNDVQWLRADTFSWQSSAVYQAAYQHLADDIDGKTLQSETVGGTTIQFYLADDGHKICPDSEESNVMAIYAATGVAWYYIIDTTNQRFKLPRTKYGFAGLRDTVGNYVPESLPNITGAFWIDSYHAATPDGAFTATDNYSAPNHGNWAPEGWRIHLDASRSSSAYQNGAPVQQRATQMYLYFYVGNFTQTALENTAGLNAELFNGKADLNLSNTASNIDFVVESQEPTAGNNYTWYRKYKSGWVEQGGRTGQVSSQVVTLLVVMLDTNYVALASCNVVGGDGFSAKAQATSTTTATISTKEYGSSKTAYINWYVVGQSAN